MPGAQLKVQMFMCIGHEGLYLLVKRIQAHASLVPRPSQLFQRMREKKREGLVNFMM